MQIEWTNEEVGQAWSAWRERSEPHAPEKALDAAMRRVMSRAVGIWQARQPSGQVSENKALLLAMAQDSLPDSVMPEFRAALSRLASQAQSAEVWRQRVDKAAEALEGVGDGEVGRLDLVARIERLKATLQESKSVRRVLAKTTERVGENLRAAESRLAAVRERIAGFEHMDGTELLATLEAVAKALDGDSPDASGLIHTLDHAPGRFIRSEPIRPAQAPAASGMPLKDVKCEHDPKGGPCDDCAQQKELQLERKPTIAELETILNAPEGTYKVEVQPDGQVRAVRRYPCSPTCTHDDAANPGHPERVRERSEAVNEIGRNPENCAAKFVTIENGVEGALPYTRTQIERYAEKKAEAMRAACLEAVRIWAERSLGVMPATLRHAIEGSTP